MSEPFAVELGEYNKAYVSVDCPFCTTGHIYRVDCEEYWVENPFYTVIHVECPSCNNRIKLHVSRTVTYKLHSWSGKV